MTTPEATTPVDPYTMTPTEADQALAAMTARARPAPSLTPTTAADARARLDALSRDAAWSKQFLAGDVAARREFTELTTLAAGGDHVADALNGRTAAPDEFVIETTMPGELPRRAVEETVAGMREAGVSDGAIEQLLRGETVTRQEVEAVKRFKAMREGDAEWVKKLLAGDYAAKRELILMSIVLSSEVAP